MAVSDEGMVFFIAKMMTYVIVLCGCDVKKMDEQKLCADCLNLSRAVYCMQCIRMNKGHKDMFRINAPAIFSHEHNNSKADFSQTEKR